MRDCLKELPRVCVGRNPSWRESAMLGLSSGVVWAPMTLWMALKEPLLITAVGLWKIVEALGIFVLMRLFLIGFGLLGRLRHTGWGYR
jgi:hypothetical protein